jgi:hypothetical protein
MLHGQFVCRFYAVMPLAAKHAFVNFGLEAGCRICPDFAHIKALGTSVPVIKLKVFD